MKSFQKQPRKNISLSFCRPFCLRDFHGWFSRIMFHLMFPGEHAGWNFVKRNAGSLNEDEDIMSYAHVTQTELSDWTI